MAITDRYITSSGTDTYANSTNPATPMSLATAITNAAAGDRMNVASGTYTRGATDTLANSGTATSPIWWRGYTTTIGDATLARSAGGALNVGSMPVLSYDATFQLNCTGNFNIFEAFNVTGSRSGAVFTLGGTDCYALNCKAANSSTNAAAIGFSANGQRCATINCDASIGASGGNSAISLTGTNSYAIGSRATAAGAIGIVAQARLVAFCTVYNCGTDGIAINANASQPLVIANTIYGCTGDGIDLIATSTANQFMLGNHITDNGGFGINGNAASVSIVQAFNRFRDNTSGATSGLTDWQTGQMNVTTDAGGAETDFASVAGADFRLLQSAVAIAASFGYLVPMGAGGQHIGVLGARVRSGY